MKIGSYLITLMLVVLIIFSSIKPSLTYAYFELDPVGFIEALCENKDKPQLQCNGKCQLQKVAKSQDKHQNTPERIADFKDLLLYPSPVLDFQLQVKISFKKQEQIAYQNLYTFHNLNNCFHPPRL